MITTQTKCDDTPLSNILSNLRKGTTGVSDDHDDNSLDSYSLRSDLDDTSSIGRSISLCSLSDSKWNIQNTFSSKRNSKKRKEKAFIKVVSQAIPMKSISSSSGIDDSVEEKVCITGRGGLKSPR